MSAQDLVLAIYWAVSACAAAVALGNLLGILLAVEGPRMWAKVESWTAGTRGPSPDFVAWCESEEGRRAAEGLAAAVSQLGVSGEEAARAWTRAAGGSA